MFAQALWNNFRYFIGSGLTLDYMAFSIPLHGIWGNAGAQNFLTISQVILLSIVYI